MYYLYILRNAHNRLYIGHTNNLERRLQDHSSQSGAKFVKDYGDFELVYFEEFASRAKAMKREKQVKGWSRAKKEALISADIETLKSLSRTRGSKEARQNTPS
ncbi:MAG: GIY-YIG nuclease family protein [Candidatus Saccharibacteria bacterium]|nr:GIY-YIG nuclease family protein [Candidatus Saccharibacteria bacterium]